MPRLTPITDREQLTGEALLCYDSIVESRGRINGPQSMHMYVPEIAKCSIITAAREMDCAYVWASHVVSGLKAGLRPEAIDIVAHFGNIDGLTDGEAIIVQYGREMLGSHNLAQDTFDSAVSIFGDSGTIALGALMGYYSMLSCTLIATDMQPSEGAPVLPSR
jgi:4-carboxymuconolactone decarboxylase